MSQVIFFKKNHADFEIPFVVVTASEANDLIRNTINRNNRSAWTTYLSQDSNNTTIEYNFVESRNVSDIILIKHNFKAFTIQYWDGFTYQNFAQPISETTNTAKTSHYAVTPVLTQKVLITITGTQVADSDKVLHQFIATERIGQFQSWPIQKPKFDRQLKISRMLSGKRHMTESIGSYDVSLTLKNISNSADLDIVEELFNSREGFLFWPSGGSETQFSSRRQGYRLEDIFLMRVSNTLDPQWYKGLYTSGMPVRMNLVEVIT